MRSECPRADFALIAITGGFGILPDATDLVTTFEPGAEIPDSAGAAINRPDRPEFPPPRF